jgi:peptidoglycan/LPS O-acetylase OafA/YrhL
MARRLRRAPAVPAQTGGLESQGDRRAGAVTRYPCFDGFRAIAATMVLLIHASIISEAIKTRRAGEFLARMDSGVIVFFVISGFLLYRPFVVHHMGGRKTVPTLNFWRRRVLRIFPAYWFALIGIVYVLHQRQIHGGRDFVTYFGLLQIYDPHRVLGVLSQAWSLCTEISYYAILPLYAWFLGRRALTPQRQLRREWIGVAVLFAIGFAFRMFVRAAGINPVAGNWLPAWIDMFAIGMGLAVASVGVERLGHGRRVADAVGRHPTLCWVAAAVAFVIVATAFDLPRGIARITLFQEYAEHYFYGLVGLAIVLPGVFGPQREGLVRRFLQSRIVVAIGVVSYGIYLWHIAVLERIDRYLGLHGGLWQFVVLAALGVAASYVVALVSYVVVEKPALKLKGVSKSAVATS